MNHFECFEAYVCAGLDNFRSFRDFLQTSIGPDSTLQVLCRHAQAPMLQFRLSKVLMLLFQVLSGILQTSTGSAFTLSVYSGFLQA